MNEKLKVCLMNDSFPPVIDGVANAVSNYAEVIANGLGSATVVTPAYPDAEDDYTFDVVRYRSVNITQKFCGYRMGYPFSSSALDELAAEEFNIIHSHCPFASTIMARVLREKTNVPIVLTYHTKFDVEIKRALPNAQLLADGITKLAVDNISSCDEVWTVSRGAGENLRSLGYAGDYVVMENGVDFPRGRADADKAAALRAKYGVPDDEILFLFVGRLMWYKGIRLILDALRLLSERGVKYRMLFVGSGLDMEDIQAYVTELGLDERCKFAGAVSDREELRVFYTAGELFLFPSDYDTNGIVVREAAACGVGSLLLKNSCAAEGITDGRNGLLCGRDAEEIAKKLEFAAAHRTEMRQLGEHAMTDVYVSWESAVKRAYDRYYTVIEKCMSGNSSRTRRKPIHDDFFRMVDNVTDGIQQVRGIPVDMLKRAERWRDRVQRAVEAFRESMK